MTLSNPLRRLEKCQAICKNGNRCQRYQMEQVNKINYCGHHARLKIDELRVRLVEKDPTK